MLGGSKGCWEQGDLLTRLGPVGPAQLISPISLDQLMLPCGKKPLPKAAEVPMGSPGAQGFPCSHPSPKHVSKKCSMGVGEAELMVGHAKDRCVVLVYGHWGRNLSCPILGDRHGLTSNVLRRVWWLRLGFKCCCVWWALNSLQWHQLERISDLIQIPPPFCLKRWQRETGSSRQVSRVGWWSRIWLRVC